MKITMIGSIEKKTRLIESSQAVDLARLCEIARPPTDSFYCQVKQSTETKLPFDITRHMIFFDIQSGIFSFRAWQEAHYKATEGARTFWHAAYFFKVVERVPGINEVHLYYMTPISPGIPTYITFADLDNPTKEAYRRVLIHQEPIAAPSYEYLPGKDWIDWVEID